MECTGAAGVIRDCLGGAAPAGIVCLTGVTRAGQECSTSTSGASTEPSCSKTIASSAPSMPTAGTTRWRPMRLHDADKGWLARLDHAAAFRSTWSEALEHRPGDIKVVIDFARLGVMPSRIEDYALIGDCQAAALVGTQRLDRLAVLAALRFRCLFRGAAGLRGARTLADRPLCDGRCVSAGATGRTH